MRQRNWSESLQDSSHSYFLQDLAEQKRVVEQAAASVRFCWDRVGANDSRASCSEDCSREFDSTAATAVCDASLPRAVSGDPTWIQKDCAFSTPQLSEMFARYNPTSCASFPQLPVSCDVPRKQCLQNSKIKKKYIELWNIFNVQLLCRLR